MIKWNARFRGAAAIIIFAATSVTAQEPLPRLSVRDPLVKVLRHVSAEAVEGVYANSVAADVVIGLDGSVESVTVVEGHQAQRASAVTALKQYRFQPVVIEGRITRAIVRIDVHVPDKFSTAALAKNTNATNSADVPAARDLVLLGDCSRALTTMDGSERALQTCRDAIAAADEAGDRAFSRRAPRIFLGDVYSFGDRWSEALASYESALSISESSDDANPDNSNLLIKMAVAQVNLGDLVRADRNAAAAARALEASIKTNPEHRQDLVKTLRQTLEFHARIKRVRGDTEAAVALERKAAALATSK